MTTSGVFDGETRVQAWIDQDPDPETRSELDALLAKHRSGEKEASDRLDGMFSGRLSFGTAGLRGPIGPGPTAMNRVVVSQTTAGLAEFLLASRKPVNSERFRVVVGCDARTNSEVFTNDTAAVLSGYGIEAIALPIELPTPVLAFAVRHLAADAGVMVTASHNPPQDNGYKVYLGGSDEGSQIISPTDRDIEARIIAIGTNKTIADIPRSTTLIVDAPGDLVDSYVSHTLQSVGPEVPTTSLSVVYTPLHGVGSETFHKVISAAGFPAVHVVPEQEHPDALFPTVSFPNPEEKGALDLSFAVASTVQADLILAHDPDADRLAVALPDQTALSGYTPLTGNQLGAILGWRATERARQTGSTGSLANSLVSSPILGKIATHFSLEHHETLTGFKYVSRVPGLLFGFEEALGYLVNPSVVRDKDGISAALALMDLAYQLDGEGKTLWDYLSMIENTVGAFASGQITLKLSPSEGTTSVGGQLRAQPPVRIGHHLVTRVDDFMDGFESFPPQDIIRYLIADGSRVIIRPSGTEPKVKIYLDTTGATGAEAHQRLEMLEQDMLALLGSLS